MGRLFSKSKACNSHYVNRAFKKCMSGIVAGQIHPWDFQHRYKVT